MKNLLRFSALCAFFLALNSCDKPQPECCCTNIDYSSEFIFLDKNNESIFKNKAILDSFRIFNVKNGQLVVPASVNSDNRAFRLDTFGNTISVRPSLNGDFIDGWLRQVVQFKWNQRDTIDFHVQSIQCGQTLNEIKYNGVTKYVQPTSQPRSLVIIKDF